MSTNVKYIRGNIFTSDAQSLVNTVNCVGVMGAGIALEFKYRYPEMFQRYVQFCREDKIKIGFLYIYDIFGTGRKVINFPTKRDWKHASKIEYLDQGLKKFLETYKEKGIRSAAFPLLGAQNGGLDPVVVRNLMTDYFGRIDIPIEIYEYAADAKDDLIDGFIEGLLYNKNEFKHSTGVSDSNIDKLREVVSGSDLTSLIQLTKAKGIGEETIKACFQFAIRVKAGKITEKALFKGDSNTHSHSSVAESDMVYDLQTGGSSPIEEQAGILTNKDVPLSDVSTSPEQAAEPEAGLGQGPKGEQQAQEAAIPDDNETGGQAVGKSGKNKKTRGGGRKSSSANTLSIGEKQLLTDLPMDVIEKIEAGSEDVTIRQLKAYAAGMKIKPKKLITDKYLTQPTS